MTNIIIPGKAQADPIGDLNLKERPLMIASSLDDGGWASQRPWNRVFISALTAICQQRPEIRGRIYVDPSMNREEQEAHMDVGVFEARVGRFSMVLNWTTNKVSAIPARHIAVAYEDNAVAIIGPFLDGRECFRCGLGSNMRADIGVVTPGVQCSNCGSVDWFGMVVQPAHLQQECAEYVANTMQENVAQERWHNHIGGDSENQIESGEFEYGAESIAGGK